MKRRTGRLELQGRVVAITGGARGIGLATATVLARRGAMVAVGDMDAEGSAAAAQQIGYGAVGLALDVTGRTSFETFLNEVEHRLGPIDVLVNNAGIQRVGRFADESDAATYRQVAVNLVGVMTGTKLALAKMGPRKRGHIVNVASIAGKIASPGGATYSATKHAVVGLSESLRGELRDSGIAVSIVLPAVIATEMADGLGSARGVKPVSPIAVGEAIAGAVARGRGVDVFVPSHTRVINTALTVMPSRMRDAVQRLMRADTVLMSVDHAARADYNSRVGIQDTR